MVPVQPHGNSIKDGSSLQCSPEWVDRGCFSHSQLLCKDCWGSSVRVYKVVWGTVVVIGAGCVSANLWFFLDVGMYVPSRIFQASQQSVKLLSSPHQHDLDGKVSSVSPRLSYPFS